MPTPSMPELSGSAMNQSLQRQLWPACWWTPKSKYAVSKGELSYAHHLTFLLWNVWKLCVYIVLHEFFFCLIMFSGGGEVRMILTGTHHVA